jgi:hypothetical protein
VTRLRAGRPRNRSSFPVAGAVGFCVLRCVQTDFGATQPIQRTPRLLPSGIKRPGRETDISPAPGGQVKIRGSKPPLATVLN